MVWSASTRFGTREIRPLEQAQDLELAFELEIAHDVVVGEILHDKGDVARERAELLRQRGMGRARHGLELVECRCFGFGPVHRALQ